ncbi:MAG: amidohydrolase family protein [Bacillota bacterium]|nr:amidohydrolase family protein [Bacillota bacterium]
MDDSFVLKGNIIYNQDPQTMAAVENGYIVVENGSCAGLFPELPQRYAALSLYDQGRRLIMPGLYDLHLHAPQYSFAGLGMDMPLLPWLERYAFPIETRYADLDYAESEYGRFVEELRGSFTCRAAIFATRHNEASLLLADKLEQSGLGGYVGRVSMDRMAPPQLAELPQQAAADERRWLEQMCDGERRFKPIITPRFVPSCTPGLLAALGELAAEYRLPVQSHLSENRDEIELVAELYPNSASYGHVYHQFGLFGGATPTLMAHCVHCAPAEQELMLEQGIYAVHCPQSNTNIMSGAAPVKQMLLRGQRLALGTDIAGGSSLSLFRAVTDAIAVSKLRTVLCDPQTPPLTTAEAYYIGSAGGGSFFGQVGRFAPGYAFDALVIDDSRFDNGHYGIEERWQRALYLSDHRELAAKYVDGRRIL